MFFLMLYISLHVIIRNNRNYTITIYFVRTDTLSDIPLLDNKSVIVKIIVRIII